MITLIMLIIVIVTVDIFTRFVEELNDNSTKLSICSFFRFGFVLGRESTEVFCEIISGDDENIAYKISKGIVPPGRLTKKDSIISAPS